MSKKKLTSLGGLVYSTDPNFKPEAEETEQQETLEPKLQKIKVSLDRKQSGYFVGRICGHGSRLGNTG
jgi:translation initiation factor 1